MARFIVIDTNIIVSALIGAQNGASRKVLHACLNGEFKPLMGAALYHEYLDLISRPEILKRCPLSSYEIEELLDAFFSTCKWKDIFYLWRPNLKDEADNQVLELAIAGGSDTIVTHNHKDFASAELWFPHIHILSPTQIIRKVHDGSDDS